MSTQASITNVALSVSPRWLASPAYVAVAVAVPGPTLSVYTTATDSERPTPLTVAEPPLDRAALLLAAVRAASAYAAGMKDAAAQRDLAGKRFELRIRFGCGGTREQGDDRGWRFDETRRTLRLSVKNDISASDPAVKAMVDKAFESVEGLWLGRPWLLVAACPQSVPPVAEPAAQAGESGSEAGSPAEAPPASPVTSRVGLAQFFTATDPRTALRRERPYESTTVLDESQAPSAQGYDFVMSGRLRALPDRRVIACHSASADMAPDCIISVRLDRAWIERPDNREMLAEWHGS